MPLVDKVVIMARGLATRMQWKGFDVDLDEETRGLLAEGAKGMVRIKGRPFLDYLIWNVKHAGLTKVCLVVSPEHNRIRDYYLFATQRMEGLEVCFAAQERPLGTADAALAARGFVGQDAFILLNGDNLYPEGALRMVRSLPPGICHIVGFDREALISKSNIEEKRIKSMAVMQVDEDWNLLQIVEKPEEPERYRVKDRILVNMNLLKLTPHIFEACQRIEPHPVRKEYEITSAIQYLVDHRMVPVKVAYSEEGVYDLTYPTDIPAVRKALEGVALES